MADWKISRAWRWPSGCLHLASRVRFGSDWFSTAVWLRVVLPGGLGAKAPTWTARVGAHGLGGFQEHALGPAEGDPEEEWELRSREAERLAEAAGFWLLRGLEWREPAEEEP